jgi:glycosyltransferase involved in cell wall biosynthesis
VYDAAVPQTSSHPAVDGVAPSSSEEQVPDGRVAALSYFFPAHDEAENIEPLVAEALAELPLLAQRFEIICVDDGSRDGTAQLADRLAAENPDVVRVVHHEVNQGYGGALRSGFGAARYALVCFTDGDRQFRIADLAALLARLAEPGAAAGDMAPDVVVGYRIKRADPPIRLAYARAYRACLRIFFGLRVHDVDCACKLFRREALEGIRLESRGAFLSAELLIKLEVRGRRVTEVGVPHYPRTAGSASGANPRVVLRAVRDFWLLRVRLWVGRDATLRRGASVLGDVAPSNETRAG